MDRLVTFSTDGPYDPESTLAAASAIGAGLPPELLAESAGMRLEMASARARGMGTSIGTARRRIAGLSVKDDGDGLDS
jgi:hypothetical protein